MGTVLEKGEAKFLETKLMGDIVEDMLPNSAWEVFFKTNCNFFPQKNKVYFVPIGTQLLFVVKKVKRADTI